METGFHPLRVTAVTPETAGAVALTLEPAETDRAKFRFQPGQHLILRAEVNGEDLRRNYSLFTAPDEGVLRIAIKRVEGGQFSAWAATGLKPGDTIESMTPRGAFTYAFEPGRRRTYVAFAAGSGITPVLSLLKTGLATERDSRFTLLYGNRTSASVMFLDDIAALKDRYLGRFEVYHFLAGEADDIELFNGRLDEPRIAAILDTLVDPAQVDAAFICGPGPMMDTAERALRAAGMDPGAILLERFSAGQPIAARRATEPRPGERVTMTVAIDGRRRAVPFDPALGNILDSARAAGLPAPYACKAGVCATCRAKLVSGKVTMAANYGLTAAEVAAGYILTCQSRPLEGATVAVDYDV